MLRSIPCLLVLLPAFLCPAFAQTPISGVINTYASVSQLDYPGNSMTLSSAAGLSIGDKVLIIQMQGAAINTINGPAFGDPTNLNGAGRYEIATICQLNGNLVTFENTLQHADYQLSGLQVIRLQTYARAVVTGTLTAAPWNGSTGGVLALAVAGKLRLDAPIDLSGAGFRGGAYQNSNNNTCSFLTNRTAYAYANNDLGGRKGEGIAIPVPGNEYGRGAQANGGGGGNDHNAGGGGGALAAAGGKGGDNQDPGTFTCKGFYPGVGGKAMPTPGRIYAGGGGGAGHGNNNLGSRGANGGGILLLIADTLEAGLSGLIRSNGLDAPNSMSDGAGGGGGGGAMHLEITTWTGAITLQARGGNGGSVDNEVLNRCFGPGGGGSGGLIYTNTVLPANVSTVLTPGQPGNTFNTTNACSGSNLNAVAGQAGLFLPENLLPVSTTASAACTPLNISFLDFSIRNEAASPVLSWTASNERPGAVYMIERRKSSGNFEFLTTIAAKANLSGMAFYTWIDVHPLSGRAVYRIQSYDANGYAGSSKEIILERDERLELRCFQPLQPGDGIRARVYVPHPGGAAMFVNDMLGRQYQNRKLPAGETDISFSNLPAGVYTLSLLWKGRSLQQKLWVK